MKPRLNFFHAAPDTLKALRALDAQVQASGLEPLLMELGQRVEIARDVFQPFVDRRLLLF